MVSKNGRKKGMSRRNALKHALAATVGGSLATTLGEPAAAAQTGGAPAVLTGTQTGRRYRGYVYVASEGTTLMDLRVLPLRERMVLIRTEATQLCYSTSQQALATPGNTPRGLAGGAEALTQPRNLGHGGVGIVEAVGPGVSRVRVGDRVVAANTPMCGVCYNCMRQRADRCQMMPANGNPLLPVAEMTNGTPVIAHNNEGGYGELMICYEWYCMPIFDQVSPLELSLLACTAACGFGATLFGVAPIEAASEVCVFGCGPIGLTAVQGARIKGASRIIAIEPIPYRRQLALQLGATHVLDPNALGDNLVNRVRELCTWPGNRPFAGGRFDDPNDNDAGPDFVIEAVGGNTFPNGPGARLDPDPTGVKPMMQAWELCSSSGHLTTLSTGQLGNFSVPGPQWMIGSKNHHPGNMNGSQNLRDIPRYARLIATGQYNAKAIATATYPLDKIREGFQAVVDRTTVAAIVTFT